MGVEIGIDAVIGLVAEVDVVVLELAGDVRREAVFETGAGRPADVPVAVVDEPDRIVDLALAIGDTALVKAPDGSQVPGIAPAAKQQGRHVAEIIKARLAGDTALRPFRYKHAGNLATIGKKLAVIDFGWLKLRGAIAWWIWGIAHIFFLIGVRNRLAVALSWLWIHTTGQRSALLITQGRSHRQGTTATDRTDRQG